MVLPAADDGGAPAQGDDDPGDQSPDDEDAGRDAAAVRDATPRADAATILFAGLTASAPQITDGQSVTFQATVNDPYGMSDVASASLTDSSGAYYGELTSAGSWTLSRTLTFADIERVRASTFGPSGESRQFIVTVANRHGRSGTASTAVLLYCNPQGRGGVCGGRCVDLGASPNCGACGVTCLAGQTCTAGACR